MASSLRTLRRVLSVASFSLLVGTGCVRSLVGTEVGPADAGKKILLAVYPTEYKNKVARGIVDRYKDRARITQVSVQVLQSVDYRNYDALVIIDQLMMWQFLNFASREFIGSIDSPDARRKIVLYLTAGTPKPNYDFEGIDAMTGATAMHREGEAIDAISRRIEPLLGNP
jgi:hypothetical protein